MRSDWAFTNLFILDASDAPRSPLTGKGTESDAAGDPLFEEEDWDTDEDAIVTCKDGRFYASCSDITVLDCMHRYAYG